MTVVKNNLFAMLLLFWGLAAVGQVYATELPVANIKSPGDITITEDKYACCIDSLGGGRIL